MTEGLRGRHFLVTGAASGIGAATTERLVAAGARVARVDRDGERLAAKTSGLGESDQTLAFTADVADERQVAEAVDATIAAWGSLHGAVTSAGIFDPGDLVDVENVDLDVFHSVLAVNLRGTLLVLRAVLPHLGAGGAVVTVASTAGLRGHGMGPSYTASKGGVIALTRLVAFQYGPRGVRANCVCPGATAGEGMGSTFADPDVAARTARGIPLGRVGTASDLGATIAALLSDETSYLSGQVIAVDGAATVR